MILQNVLQIEPMSQPTHKMNDTGRKRRIGRMLRECKVSAAPAVLLAAASAALALAIGMGLLVR